MLFCTVVYTVPYCRWCCTILYCTILYYYYYFYYCCYYYYYYYYTLTLSYSRSLSLSA